MPLGVEEVEAGEDPAEVPVGGVQEAHADEFTADGLGASAGGPPARIRNEVFAAARAAPAGDRRREGTRFATIPPTMPLSIRAVTSLQDVLPPAVAFLSRPADLFARPRIVVPNPGARAWLTAELARALGTRGGGDGIVANVEISFPGTITGLLQPVRSDAPDPWSFDRLTFSVLDVITGPDAATLDLPFDVARGPLMAAHRIAGLFDSYHVRRPGMILEWEREHPNRVLSPTANDEQQDGVPVPDKLRDGDRWQFELWRAVRHRIGSPSPPARLSLEHRPSPAPLLVAGVQSLSLHQLQCLECLGEAGDVEVLLVHPSPGLRSFWRPSLPGLSLGMPPRRHLDPDLPDGVDQLLPVWLSGAREVHELLASQGVPLVEPSVPASFPAATAGDTVLARMQATVAAGREAESLNHDRVTDHSLAIHRCHSLSRQAEVLHDALLHAFQEIEGLEPHDVVIVSPCIQKAAPHLEAVFQRTIAVRDPAGKQIPIRLPLVVADRGIREISAAADLLVSLLALPGGRCSIDDVLGLAGHPLVRAHFACDDDTVAFWADLAERTNIRWGLDGGHRGRRGLVLANAATINTEVHTWKLGLERMLLGATLPDDGPRPELGGVVPLTDLDPDDIAAITKLVRILGVVRTLEEATAADRPPADWCDAIEAALVGLCGEECRELAEPFAHLRRLRDAAGNTAAESRPIPFEDVRQLLAGWFDEQAGRQPLRTGAITATSMVPLRGVPFKVVCVIGYDDGAVGASEADGDDLVARQQLVGDVDPRIDERRALLDCLLAARNRLVITCTGQSIKNNERLPLVTPLAELVDFAVRHGVRRDKLSGLSGIEVSHPRHHLSRGNFIEGKVLPGMIWSHDPAAAAVAPLVGQPSRPDGVDPGGGEAGAGSGPAAGGSVAEAMPVIELPLVVRMIKDPLRLHVEETLGIDTWRDDEAATPATFPLALEARDVRTLALELLGLLITDPAAEGSWIEAVRQSGRLPFGLHGERQLAEIAELARGIRDEAAAKEVPLAGTETRELRIDVPGGRVVGHVAGVHEATRRIVVVTAAAAERKSSGRPLHVAAMHLVAARAAGLDVERVSVVARNGAWQPGELSDAGRPINPCQIRTIVLGPGVDPGGRLADLCGLVRDAMAGPCGLFGLADGPPDRRPETFADFVGGKNWATGERTYPRKTEALVYGLAPAFEQVFAAGSRELAFLDRYIAALTLTSRGTTYSLT
jgi:exodeoxyribonuclease V gamma subunit